MNKFYFIFICMILLTFTIFSCEKDAGYQKPYTPGVYVDRTSFNEHMKLWNENPVNSYSYTYSWCWFLSRDCKSPLYNHVVDVVVTNGEISNYTLKEYNCEKENEVSEDKWKNNLKSFEHEFKDVKSINNFLINNVYAEIEKMIDESFDSFKEHPDSYYEDIKIEFSNTLPYIVSFDSYSMIMEKDLDGNSGCIVIKIENFKS